VAKSIGRLISILYRKSLVYMNSALKEYGLTASEQPFLTSLYHYNGMTQEQLSEHLNIDKAATARVVQSLVAKGFVVKRKAVDDKRFNRIFLTEKGKESKRYVLPILSQWSELLAAGMDEETRDALYGTLETMVSHVGQ